MSQTDDLKYIQYISPTETRKSELYFRYSIFLSHGHVKVTKPTRGQRRTGPNVDIIKEQSWCILSSLAEEDIYILVSAHYTGQQWTFSLTWMLWRQQSRGFSHNYYCKPVWTVAAMYDGSARKTRKLDFLVQDNLTHLQVYRRGSKLLWRAITFFVHIVKCSTSHQQHQARA